MKFFAIFYSLFLRLRYRVKIIGIENIIGKKSNLYLPNHQAEVDPQLIMSIILRYDKVTPMISSYYYNLPGLKLFFKSMGAISVSDLEKGHREENLLNNLETSAINELKVNKSILLYPGGQLTGQGYERIYNKQSAYQIAKKLPQNSHIIGVRISGLWGSVWSRAWIGRSPDFIPTYLKSIWYVIANLFFFLPKRTVTIEFEDLTQKAKEAAENLDRKEFNTFLEAFYNIYGEEKPLFLKHYFYSPKLKRHLPEKIQGSDIEYQKDRKFNKVIPVDIFKTVSEALAKELKIESSEIKKETSLIMDLNLDSLGLVAVVTEIEKKYPDIKTPDINDIKTVYDLCLMAMNLSLEDSPELKPSTLHITNEEDYAVMPNPNLNILELFIKEFNKNPHEYFAWDNTSGTSTRGGFFLKTAVVSNLIRKKVKGKHVGIMLPALQSTTLLIAASYMAGKIPVMLNWTVGQKVLTYCADISQLDVIITAGPFYEKIKDQIPDSVASRLMFLEKEVQKLSLSNKIGGLIKSKFPKLFINTKIDETAVILFTSGSEANPKAVPLTHKNCVTDLWGALNIIDIKHNSIFLSFLPPFHSFGFVVLSVLPMITSFKVAYTPNPTNIKEVVNVLRHTRATNVMVTPTFLKMMMANANKYDFRTVELVISGAESLPLATKTKFEEMTAGRALIIEGYGITECSPIVSLNPLDSQKLNSVGKFIKGIDGKIVNLDDYSPTITNEEGMIIVSGDSVFNGYLDENIESPFINIEEKKYYKTGDLGYLDEDGFIYITGRLKRFIKIGGEMISMPMIEKILLEFYGNDEKVVLAVEGTDKNNEALIALFSTISLELQEVNKQLRNHGLSGLNKIHKIIVVNEIPILGSGKTDYKLLKNML
jgi:acyl carrier protein